MKLRVLAALFFLCFVYTQNFQAQLSKTHYIPPLTYAEEGNANPREHYFYISTPKNKIVNYTIKQIGNSANDISGQVSNNDPQIIEIGEGVSQLFIESNQTSVIINNKGFIIEADDVIYVSLRVLAGNNYSQAGALVSKGSSALGKIFRAGMFTNQSGRTVDNSGPSENLMSFISVLATENNTTVNFSDISNSTEIQNFSGNFPVDIVLNEGESYVIAMNSYSTAFPDNNKDGLIGTLIESDKDIVVNTGSANGSFSDGNGRDYGIEIGRAS